MKGINTSKNYLCECFRKCKVDFYTKIFPGTDYITNSSMFIAALVSLTFLSMVKYRIVKLV
jgi:hypothetical protein